MSRKRRLPSARHTTGYGTSRPSAETKFGVRSLVLLAIVAVTTTSARTSSAQSAAAPASATTATPPAPAPLATSLTGPAREEYVAARNLFEIGDHANALLKFRHAFELSKDVRLLWNMAACEKEMHHYARAVTYVDRYLREGGDKLNPETRANAAATRDALQGLYSAGTLVGAPAGATVSVDGESFGKTPLPDPIPLDVGNHTIRVEHPDYEPLDVAVDDVLGGKPITVPVAMKVLSAGRLRVLAGPGDTIVVDGKAVGSETWEGPIAPGPHVVRVTAVKKKPFEVSLAMAPRGSRTIQVTLQDAKKLPWPLIVGGAVLAAGGAALGGYLLFKPEDKPGPYTSGGLATVQLPAAFR